MGENENEDIVLQLKRANLLAEALAKDFEENLKEAEQKNKIIHLLQTIAIAANEAATSPDAFQIAVDEICAFTGWSVGHCYIYDEKEALIRSTGNWHLSDLEKYRYFQEQSDGFTATPGDKSWIGTVFKGDPSWVPNIQEEPSFMLKDVAKQCGLKAAFAFPIFVKESVGVMEFFSKYTREPEGEVLMLMVNVGKQLGHVVARKQAEEKARLMEAVVVNANDGIIITTADSLDAPGPEIIYVNEAFTKLTGYQKEEVIGGNPRILQGDETKRETLDTLRQSLTAGKPFKGEL